ncbi:hypothetical protein [Desulfurococcus mucosus]|uniref:Glycosyltransferase RgtA/B/C/D-like domain-containing protein n=1 Tax=Desulfurococcus mucosus (strain ATCC 35584 / DSM 2162 / JCM 9187 / O7/1) TaxID=765177 RepID=E8R8G3_DESM0|nr:hypothetical protein [Desulfurococcus mucosus]ADV64789.1 hypothetical protein Desmu_0476 [Desulfurococcus mucosus DSM 2162]
MSGRSFLVFLVFTATLLIHVAPFLYTLHPFSTDVWPLIRVSERLVSEPWVKIYDDSAFDGYNNRWPGIALASAVASLLTGLNVPFVYGILMAAALSIAMCTGFYAVARRLGGSVLSTAAMMALPSFTVFTSAALKEVYSYPLMASAALVILAGSRLGFLTALPLLAAAQVVTHHLSTLMTIVIFAEAGVLELVDAFTRGLRASGFYRRAIPYSLLTAAMAYTYMEAAGSRIIAEAVDPWDMVTAALYLALYTAIYAASRGRPESPAWRGVVSGLLLTAAVAPAVWLSWGFYSYDASSIIPYAAGFILVLSTPRRETVLSNAAAVSAAGVLSFTAFSKPGMGSIAHRVLNYAAIYLGFTVVKETRTACVIALAGFIIASGVMAQLLLGMDQASFYWVYRDGDSAAAGFLESFTGDTGVIGDAKLYYMEEMRLRVDTALLLRLLYTGRCPSNSIIAVSSENVLKGFAEASSVYRLTDTARRLLGETPVVYSSHAYSLYWCPP